MPGAQGFDPDAIWGAPPALTGSGGRYVATTPWSFRSNWTGSVSRAGGNRLGSRGLERLKKRHIVVAGTVLRYLRNSRPNDVPRGPVHAERKRGDSASAPGAYRRGPAATPFPGRAPWPRGTGYGSRWRGRRVRCYRTFRT